MLILEIIFRGIIVLIVEIFGLNVRYFILKLFNPKITKEQLETTFQNVFNIIVGLPVFALICISIVYDIDYLIRL